MHKYFLIIIIFMISCSELDYYPKGKSGIAGYNEYIVAGTKTLNIFYAVTNTGLSKINSYSISFKIKTDASEYYKSVNNQSTINVSNFIYGEFSLNLNIPYITNMITNNISNLITNNITNYYTNAVTNVFTNFESVKNLTNITIESEYYE